MKQKFTQSFINRLMALGVVALGVWCPASAEKTEVATTPDMEGWTVINANNDDYQWAWDESKQMAVVPENRKEAANDWLMTPVVNLKGGVTYKIRVWVRNLSTYSSDKSKFALTVGTSTAPDDHQTVYSLESLTRTSWAVERPDGDKLGLFTPEADGEYYLGLHCYSASYNGDFGCEKFTYEEVVALPGAVTGLKAEAAAGGEMRVDLQWNWPETNSSGGDLSEEILGARIYRSNTSSVSATDACLIKEVEGGEKGATATYTDVPESAGTYYYMVVPFTANGASDATALKANTSWVGEDNGVGTIASVTATVIDDTTVEVAFDAPAGSNGGWIDQANITYNITRKSGSGVTVTLEEDYAGELPYVDASIPGLDTYTYTVYGKYNGSGSSWNQKTSNTVKCGGALSLPYSNDFATSANIEMFTVFYGPEGSRNWNVSSGQAYFWGGSVADAWMITPKFDLKAGKSYAITFRAKLERGSEADYKTLAVTIGHEATAESQTRVLFDETFTSTIYAEKVVNFAVETDGRYCIGFHCHGQSNFNGIYVDDLLVEETVARPMPVAEVNVTAGESGALTATVSFDTPSETTAGTPIEELTKVEVMREGTLIATRENVAAGSTVTVDDNELENAGLYSYSVVTYLGEEASDAAVSAKIWIGTDTPGKVQAVAVEKTSDSEVTVTFDAVTEGANGGYIDASGVRYTVTRMPDAVVVADGVAETTVVDHGVDALALQSYTYEVVAGIGDEFGEATVSESIVLGDAIELPYSPDLTDASTFALWSFVAAEGNDGWEPSSKGLMCQYVSNAPYAYTPPFKAPAGDYLLTCNVLSYNGQYHEMVDIVLSTEPVHVAAQPADENGVEAHEGAPAVHKVLQTVTADDGWSNNFEIPFEIENGGTYHIGFRNVSNLNKDVSTQMRWGNWTCYLADMGLSLVKLNTGVEEVAAGEKNLRYDAGADCVVADVDCVIAVYDISGSRVSGADTKALPAGVYIAVGEQADGGRLTLRFAKH
ncbi:MAG: choice-of-anchor J domain-containing protein [Muribaculaceae bacterium]|nr:choice-of-anchor J domain-containing protein [Muribaculaceae bacterium]